MFTFDSRRVPHGFGLFVWNLPKVGGVSGCIAQCKQLGLDGIFLKGADGDSLWTNQFTRAIVDQFHAAGIGVIGWQYVYGGPGNNAPAWSTVAGEIAAMKYILACGADGYLFDDEVEIDNKPAVVVQYGQALRAAWPHASIGYNPYPYPSSDTSQPFFEFNDFCDYCMPQLYVGQDGFGTPAAAYVKMVDDFAYWSPIWVARGGRAAVPLNIDWQAASWPGAYQPDSFITDAASVSVGKVPLITYWDMDALTVGESAAVAQASKIFHAGGTGPMSIAIDRDSTGKVIGAHDVANPALKVGAALGQEIAKNNWTSGDIDVPEYLTSEGVSLATLRGNGPAVVMTHTAANGTATYVAADLLKAVSDVYHSMIAAQQALGPDVAAIAALSAKIAAAQKALA